jgi:hypothetical protein
MLKYKNKITEVDGIKFRSKKEAHRFRELVIMERENLISSLQLQVPYKLIVNNIIVGKYVADFVYVENGKTIVEDVKGMRTSLYKLKKALMKSIYGIEIFET